MSRTFPTIAFILLAGTAAAAVAQPSPPPAAGGDHHADEPDTIIVTALRRDRADLLGGVSVLDGAELRAQRRTSIGETLAGLPGVSATSFGPTASRPVLRGFQGDRIRVLNDGIGSFDVSSSSVDHGVAINPLLAERIEVLRGPAALIYGSSAIGGVVNVLGTRIPRSVPDEPFHLNADADLGSAAREARGAAVADVDLGGGFVAHVDGAYARTDDLRGGGFVLSPAARAEALASGDAEAVEAAALRGRIPNSWSRVEEVGGGIAYVDAGGSLGVSVGRYATRYGVPNRYDLGHGDHGDHDGHDDHDHDHGHGHSHEDVSIDMRQTRLDLRGELTPAAGFVERATLRAGYGDYVHEEIEDDGAVGTTFLNRGLEGRLDIVQRRRGAWGGAFGAQVTTRDFEVIGEEAFVPPTTTEQLGLFAVQNLDLGAVRLEAGGRYEHTGTRAANWIERGIAGTERRFDAWSGSVGGSVGVAPGTRIGLNLSHAERAPTVEELFADGAHAATLSYEVGDRTFAKERSRGAELVFRTRGDRLSVEVSGYYSDFSNFIYQTPTGGEDHGLPVFAYRSGGAEQWGVEGEVRATVADLGTGRIVASAIGDYVRVTIDDAGAAPFIPPLRVLGGIGYESAPVDVRAEVEHVTAQNRIAAFETRTGAFTLLNARAEWRPGGPAGALSLRVAANNILDVDARRHASRLKDFAPLAGRDIRVGASLRF